MVARIEKRRKEKKPKKGTFLLMQLRDDVHALNTAVTLLSQKMKHLVRNEKILGRNLVILNKKFKELSEKGVGGAMAESVSGEAASADQLAELNEKLESLKLEVNELKTQAVSQEDVSELKHVVDSINPLEYVTLEQAKEMIASQLKKNRPLKKGRLPK